MLAEALRAAGLSHILSMFPEFEGPSVKQSREQIEELINPNFEALREKITGYIDSLITVADLYKKNRPIEAQLAVSLLMLGLYDELIYRYPDWDIEEFFEDTLREARDYAGHMRDIDASEPLWETIENLLTTI